MDFLSRPTVRWSCKIPGAGRSLTPIPKVSPAIDVRDRYTGADVVATLTRVCRDHGCPRTIRVDNGPEFISRDLDLWAYMNGVTLDFSRPGKCFHRQ